MRFSPHLVALVAMLGCTAAGSPHATATPHAAKADSLPQETILPAHPDTAAESRKRDVAEVARTIRGRGRLPAESVYKDIRVLKGLSAGTLLAVMDVGYGRSLGVGCSHCHVSGEWEREDSTRKQVAREMSLMVRRINTELLAKIEHLRSDTARVNCTTCHRGSIKPALDFTDAP
jgi:hypothetical protein